MNIEIFEDIILNVVLIVFWMSCISSIFLYITSQIIENKKYNPNDFIITNSNERNIIIDRKEI